MKQIVALALQEDLGSRGDITSRAIFGSEDSGAARVVCHEACVISGMSAAAEVCFQVDPELEFLPLVEDGQAVPAGAEVARLDGRLVSILVAERTLLNFISRLSGIASLTAGYVNAVSGMGVRIAATRKTSPGLRRLEKQAVADGGGELHRIGLYDAVLIKDNHLSAAGGVGDAVKAVRQALGPDVAVEVEVETAREMTEAMEAEVDRVMLDNMTPEEVASCVHLAAGRVVIEASGGINLENVRAYAAAGADILSVGALTRSAPGIDFSLETHER